MRLGYCLLILALLAVTLPGPVADAAVLYFAAEPNGWECDLANPGVGGEVVVYVILESDWSDNGVTGAAFSAPVPTESGFIVVRDEAINAWISGNSHLGLTAYVDGCYEDQKVTLMAIHLQRISGGSDCVFYRAAEFPGVGLTYLDCSRSEKPLTFYSGVLLNSDGTCSHATLPTNPVPANGATNVPLVTTLTWDDATYLCEFYLCGGEDQLYFGTTTDPPLHGYWFGVQIGPLQPGTTYFWRGRTGCPPSEVGPLWSFTTTTDVATKHSTWGAIKALYR